MSNSSTNNNTNISKGTIEADSLINLAEMKGSLEDYHKERASKINENLNSIKHESFKKNFYDSLNGLLNQIYFIKNKELRMQKINSVFVWYKEKIVSFDKLKYIDKRTDKNIFEKYPNMETYIKDNTYKADNYPKSFEFDHRTEEDGMLPPKDKLKEFKTKKLNIVSLENKDENENNNLFWETNIKNNNYLDKTSKLTSSDNDKLRLLSAASSIALRTTNYTVNPNSTGNKFFTPTNIPNIEAPFDPVREIKSSYSTLRPKYDYSNLQIEKITLQHKNRELAEKRHQEEVKEFVNQWGISKAVYDEEINKKKDLKLVISHYEKVLNLCNNEQNINNEDEKESIKEDSLTEKSFQNSKKLNNIENEPKDKFFIKKSDSNLSNSEKTLDYNNQSENKEDKDTESKNSNETELNQIVDNKAESQLDEYIPLPKTNYKNIRNLVNCISSTDKINNQLDESHMSNKTKEIKSSILQVSQDNSIFFNVADGPKTSKQKDNLLLVSNPDEIVVRLKLKENNAFNNKQNKLIKESTMKGTKIPSELAFNLNNNDKVSKIRLNYSSLIGVKEIDPPIDSYRYHFNPLSAYDGTNIGTINVSTKYDSYMTNRPKTGFNFIRKNQEIFKDNLLVQRQTLNNFFVQDIHEIKSRLTSAVGERKVDINKLMEAYMAPPEKTTYPKYFLPVAGCGLLNKPVENITKKRKAVKKKK